MAFLKEFFKKVDFEKNQQTTKNMKNFPGGKELTSFDIRISQGNVFYHQHFQGYNIYAFIKNVTSQKRLFLRNVNKLYTRSIHINNIFKRKIVNIFLHIN